MDAAYAGLMVSGRRFRIVGARIVDLEDFDADKREPLIASSAWSELFLLERGMG
jgi:hypothetical protein